MASENKPILCRNKTTLCRQGASLELQSVWQFCLVRDWNVWLCSMCVYRMQDNFFPYAIYGAGLHAPVSRKNSISFLYAINLQAQKTPLTLGLREKVGCRREVARECRRATRPRERRLATAEIFRFATQKTPLVIKRRI